MSTTTLLYAQWQNAAHDFEAARLLMYKNQNDGVAPTKQDEEHLRQLEDKARQAFDALMQESKRDSAKAKKQGS